MQDRYKGEKFVLTSQNSVPNQSDVQNSVLIRACNNASKESIRKPKAESAIMRYYQESCSESKIGVFRLNEGSLPPLSGSKITVTMTDSNIYVPLSSK